MFDSLSSLPWKRAAAVSLCAVVAACSAESGPVAPELSDWTDLLPSFTVTGDGPQEVTLCKVGPAGSWADFEITADGGVLQVSSPLHIVIDPSGATCVTIWKPVDPPLEPDPTVTLTVTEIDMTFGTYIDHIVVNGPTPVSTTSNSATVNADYTTGGIIAFKNSGVPHEGGQGCTPGYWRQEQHFGNWTAPYTPGSLFGSVFEDAFPGQTLLDAVWLRGGGLNALGRHTVAALLNAASPDVDYGMTPQEVIDAFNAVYPGSKGDYTELKDFFAARNEYGCDLARAELAE